MLAKGIERQKEIKASANNTIRDKYMNQLNMRPNENESKTFQEKGNPTPETPETRHREPPSKL